MKLFDEMEAGSHYIKTLGKYEITKEWGRIYLKTDNNEESIKILKNIFGIVSISPAIKIETNIEKITKKSLVITKKLLSNKNSFALRVNRVGTHNFTSMDIANQIGKEMKSKAIAPSSKRLCRPL